MNYEELYVNSTETKQISKSQTTTFLQINTCGTVVIYPDNHCSNALLFMGDDQKFNGPNNHNALLICVSSRPQVYFLLDI